MSNPTTITAEPGTPFIDVVREFDATPAQVYRAHTEPDLIAQWLGPRDLAMKIETCDVRSGGSYRYIHTDADGNEYAFRGVFHTVSPELIIQTFEFDGAPGSVTLESMALEDLGGRTRLRAHSVFPSVEERDAALESGMEPGIRESYDRLAELIARGV